MSAEILRRAAALIRDENAPVDQRSRCACEDGGETFTDHWFDRSICPEPCGMMHDICVECGYPKGGCSVMAAGRANGDRLASSWLAAADWLDRTAAWADVCGYDVVQPTDPPSYERAMYDAGVAVARAYLGEQS